MVHYSETPLLNECKEYNVTCDSGKVCVDHVGNYSCECPEGKTGDNCDQGKAFTSILSCDEAIVCRLIQTKL